VLCCSARGKTTVVCLFEVYFVEREGFGRMRRGETKEEGV
jgi:hypothetical protein